MKNLTSLFLLATLFLSACSEGETPVTTDVLGYELLTDINGHWVGHNQTSFGFFDWFAFDFRPISASHSHSIYEGGTNSNIITSVFLADFDSKLQVMARNGGWLGSQYRATYFVLDAVQKDDQSKYYRLVDAVGGENRSYMEFRFEDDSIFIDAYKDNSGALDKPVHHMGFAGTNRNPSYANAAKSLFDYPQKISEVDLDGKFTNLIDPDSALFLEKADDPFPKEDHGHLSDLNIEMTRNTDTQGDALLLFISKREVVSDAGTIDFESLDNSVIRTINIKADEKTYLTTYLHPDEYYLTIFSDKDNNNIPSSGDHSSVSTLKKVGAESNDSQEVEISQVIP